MQIVENFSFISQVVDFNDLTNILKRDLIKTSATPIGE